MFDWSELGVGGWVGGERNPLLWQWRTNINLLQQSIFHHTYSQGTSQSGLYPFCQWLPSSIKFIENYTPDRCSSRPLSICRGVVEVVVGWLGVCAAAETSELLLVGHPLHLAAENKKQTQKDSPMNGLNEWINGAILTKMFQLCLIQCLQVLFFIRLKHFCCHYFTISK